MKKLFKEIEKAALGERDEHVMVAPPCTAPTPWNGASRDAARRVMDVSQCVNDRL